MTCSRRPDPRVLFVLVGLHYPPEVTDHLARGVLVMIDWRDSSLYQQIVSEGRPEGRREAIICFLLMLGPRRFGPVPSEVRADIEGMTDLERLWRLIGRFLDATSWDDLLATP